MTRFPFGRHARGTRVVGGPCDGQRVRDIVTAPDGSWVLDRTWLCRPVEQRGTPSRYYPYVLRGGRYVWNDDDK